VYIGGGESHSKEAAGSVNIQGGDNAQRLGAGFGGDVKLVAGASPRSAGGSLLFQSGASQVISGSVAITSADSKSSGDVRIRTGSALESSGAVTLETGNSTTGHSGSLNLRSGVSGVGGAGSVNIAAGRADQASQPGGSVFIQGGTEKFLFFFFSFSSLFIVLI
jgi:hypothetical protein